MGVHSVLVLAGLIISIAAYQNCSRVRLDGLNLSTQSSTEGNGSPYEGKILISTERCTDSTPYLKLKVESSRSALLIKNQCAVLAQPLAIVPTDLDLDRLTYLGRPLELEQNVVNKIAFVQRSVGYHSSSAATIMGRAMAAPVTSGNLVICSILYNSPNGTARATDVRDNLGNEYRTATPPFGGARAKPSGGYTAEVWYAENARGGAGMVATVTFSEPVLANQSLRCYEYSGIQPVNSLDRMVYAYASDGNGTYPLGPIHTNWSNELIFVAHWGNTQSPSFGDFTVRESPDDGALDMFATSVVQGLSLTVTGEPDSAFTAITFRGLE